MGKTWMIGVGVVVLAIGVGVGAPYVIGQSVEQRFRESVDEFATESGVPVEVTRYDRHWFSATARTQVVRNTKRIEIDHVIHHGPWPDLAWATVESRPIFDALPNAQQLFDGPPLTVTTRLGLSGGTKIAVDSPAAAGQLTNGRGEKAEVEWGGLTGTFSVVDHEVRLDINAPTFRFAIAEGALRFNGLRLHSEGWDVMRMADTAGKWASNASLSVDELSFRDDEERVVSLAGKLSSEMKTIDDTELVYSNRFQLRDIALSGIGSAPIAVESAGLSITLAGLQLEPLENMVGAMQQFQQQLQATDGIARERADTQMGLLSLEYLPKIFAGSPKLMLDVPAMRTSHGEVGASLEVALAPGVGTTPADPMQALGRTMQRLAVQASAFADKPFMQWLTGQAEAPAEAREMVSQLIAQQMLVAEDDRISARVYYDVDTLKINGKPAPPEMLQGLWQSMRQDTAATDVAPSKTEVQPGALTPRERYNQRLYRHLVRHNRYPDAARAQRQEGTVMLYFVVEPDGRVADWEIRESSGHAVLDDAVRQMLEEAQPLPAMPDTLDLDRLALTVPIRFQLN